MKNVLKLMMVTLVALTFVPVIGWGHGGHPIDFYGLARAKFQNGTYTKTCSNCSVTAVPGSNFQITCSSCQVWGGTVANPSLTMYYQDINQCRDIINQNGKPTCVH